MKTLRSIFLAGKITGNDWRRGLVRRDLALHPHEGYACLINQVCCGEPLRFPVAERGVLSLLDYVGPYHVRPDPMACACAGSSHNHGAWQYDMKRAIVHANRGALAAADVVFAWIDDGSAIGTAYELGYARALGKEVWIAGPRYIEEFGLLYEDAVCSISDPTDGYDQAGLDVDPYSAFLRLLSSRLSNGWDRMTVDPALLSPIEEKFLRAWNAANPDQVSSSEPYLGLCPQYPIDAGRYRLDFACMDDARYAVRQPGVAIELDGLQAHSTTEQIAHDRRRQREIEAMGWRVVRFGGKEVHGDVDGCVAEVRRLIGQMRDDKHARWREADMVARQAGAKGEPILDETGSPCAQVDWVDGQSGAAAR